MADGWFRYLTRKQLSARHKIEYHLRMIFAHLERLLRYYQANRTGELMSRATNDWPCACYRAGRVFAKCALGFVIAVALSQDRRPADGAGPTALPLVTIATRYWRGHSRPVRRIRLSWRI